MAEWFVVRDDTSLADMRRLHLIRAGKKLEIQEVMKEYEIEPGQVAAVFEYEESDTGMWHMRLYWRTNEVKTVEV